MIKILGQSTAVNQLLQIIQKVAGNKTNVLIIGESGTGKELVARMIHESGPLKNKPFIPVNCGAIPENLIESELFGHKKGSFTGAVSEKMGLFEAADGGTLFLDEVGELPLSMQVKLLRAIQERVVRRVGGNDDIKIDVRIIAATNRDLEQAVRKGTFREDLYYRLNVILIKTPPLRERFGDIDLLAEAFLKKFCEKQNKNLKGLSKDTAQILRDYRWPGNIRELENVIERAVTLESTDEVQVDSLPSEVIETVGLKVVLPENKANLGDQSKTESTEIRIPSPDFTKGAVNLDAILGEVEKQYLIKALEHTGGIKKKAADLLGITFRSIRYRLTKLGLEQGQDDESE